MSGDLTSVPSRARELSWAVVGSSGFVGSGVVEALQEAAISDIRKVRAPRLESDPENQISSAVERFWADPLVTEAVEELTKSLYGVDVVINAAGLAAPDAAASAELFGANSLLPIVVAEAAQRAGVQKFIHISSAAVQGARAQLDETPDVDPFSPYSKSKAYGEELLALWQRRQNQDTDQVNRGRVVVIRATSVQGRGRKTSAALQKVAKSKLSSVAAPGSQPSVVSSLQGLAHYVLTIGAYTGPMPQILLQPWEGASVRQVLELAGKGRKPLIIPRWLARTGVRVLQLGAKIHPKMHGISRRLEVLWFGQDQVSGWAVDMGVARQYQDRPSDSLYEALGSDE